MSGLEVEVLPSFFARMSPNWPDSETEVDGRDGRSLWWPAAPRYGMQRSP
jgi:hypothetical protein